MDIRLLFQEFIWIWCEKSSIRKRDAKRMKREKKKKKQKPRSMKERVNENGKGPTFRNCTLFFEFLRELLVA